MIQTDPNRTLSDRRAALRLSERQLAEMAQVSRTSVRKAEAGMELRPVVRAAIEDALTRAESGSQVPNRHGLYYVTRDGDVLNLTADDGAPPVGALEGSVLRALLGYALDQYRVLAA